MLSKKLHTYYIIMLFFTLLLLLPHCHAAIDFLFKVKKLRHVEMMAFMVTHTSRHGEVEETEYRHREEKRMKNGE